jgi:hypothetical protein
MNYAQTFQLLPDGQGSYYVFNDIFRLIYNVSRPGHAQTTNKDLTRNAGLRVLKAEEIDDKGSIYDEVRRTPRIHDLH